MRHSQTRRNAELPNVRNAVCDVPPCNVALCNVAPCNVAPCNVAPCTVARLGPTPRALRYRSYRHAVDISPRDYRAWYGLGQTYEILQVRTGYHA